MVPEPLMASEESGTCSSNPNVLLQHTQVEFANLLVLNKVDLVTPEQADQLEALLRKLNVKAKVTTTLVAFIKSLEKYCLDISKAAPPSRW